MFLIPSKSVSYRRWYDIVLRLCVCGICSHMHFSPARADEPDVYVSWSRYATKIFFLWQGTNEFRFDEKIRKKIYYFDNHKQI